MSTSPVLEKVTSAENQLLDYVDQATAPAADAVRRASESVERYIPEFSMPRAERLPSFEEVVDSQFDFAVALMERQRKLFKALVEAATPVSAKLASVPDSDGSPSASTNETKAA